MSRSQRSYEEIDRKKLEVFRLAQETHSAVMVKLVHRPEVVILQIDEIREITKRDQQGEYSRWLILSTVIKTHRHYRRFYAGEVLAVKLLSSAEAGVLSGRKIVRGQS